METTPDKQLIRRNAFSKGSSSFYSLGVVPGTGSPLTRNDAYYPTTNEHPGQGQYPRNSYGNYEQSENNNNVSNETDTVYGQSRLGVKRRKSRKGKKWSMNYKRSINCRRPKGFSQKAHCAARRKRKRGGKTKSNPV